MRTCDRRRAATALAALSLVLACTDGRTAGVAGTAARAHRVVARPAGDDSPVEVVVPGGTTERYVAARLPGGARRVRLTALDEGGRVLARDDGQGVLDMPRLKGLSGVARLRVESLDGTPGAVRVYANDAVDADHDGLGAGLEAALGTCDAVVQPGCGDGLLGEFFRRVAGGTRDSDRDGLDDAEELLGAEGQPAVDLPAWGADPRHKDLFIEADYRAKMGSVQLDEADLVEVAGFYMAGSAEDLKNPDGLPGVHLHVDVGFAPADPGHAALFGDWGGSNAVDEPDYHRAAKTQLTPSRRGRFRHLLVQVGGTGQGKVLGDHFTFNRNYYRVRVFAHELGHTLGLRHHGLDAWGSANCKPNYVSLMNYVYQNVPGVGFATSAALELDPRLLFERDGIGVDDPSLLRQPPFELDTFGRAVDWNRNGRIDSQPVRAAATWATYKSCGELARGKTSLQEGDFQGSTPALVASADRLFALWVDSAGKLWVRYSETSGPDAQGSCPLGDAIDTRCSSWSKPQLLPTAAELRHVSATVFGEGVVLTLVTTEGALLLQRLTGLDGREQGTTAVATVPGPRVQGPASPSGLEVDATRFGESRLLGVLFLDARGVLGEALARGPEGPFLVRELRDTFGRAITSALPPSQIQLAGGASCGAFPDREGFIRLYCYDAAQDGWADLSETAFYAGLGPRSTSRVGMAFHLQRASDGSTLDPTGQSGALYLAFTDDADPHYPNLPWLLVSETFDARRAVSDVPRFRWQGQLINQWTSLVPGAGVALYEDRSLSALKALLPLNGRERNELLFLPLADGSYGARLGSGNDFRVMETGICTGLRGRARCQ